MTRYKLIDDQHIPFTAEEEAARDAEEVAYIARQARESIMARIMDLEDSVTARRIREAILQTDGGWLENVNGQIAALRAQLTP